MTFMDSLASNPSSGVYGQPGQTSDSDVLGIVNRIKDREMQDFQDKARFTSDLSFRNGIRERALFSPEQQQNKPMDVVEADPNKMTGYERGELGIRQQGLQQNQQQMGLDREKLAQQGKLGQEALDVRTAQEKLNQQKSDQIDAVKQAETERKINEANAKIDLAQQKIQQSADNAAAQIAAHKELQDAVEERHKIEIAQKDAQFQDSKKLHEAQIKAMQDRLDQAANSSTTTEVNADGTKKTVTTQRGSTVKVTGKDGNTYEIPADKVDEWNREHSPDSQSVGEK